MLLADVSIYLYARRRESPRHEEYREWLEQRLGGAEPFGVSELVLSAFLRIVTHHRIYREPTPPRAALAFCDAILTAVTGEDRRTGQVPQDVRGAVRLPRLRPQREQLRHEHPVGADQRLHRHRGRDVGHRQQLAQIVQGQ